MSETPRRFCPRCGEEYGREREVCPEDGTTLRDLDLIDGEDEYLVGETLDDRYVLEEKIGEGGMGYVYLADQLSIDRQVAVKVMKPGGSNHEVVVKRFYREAQVISEIQHPNVVNLFDFGRDARGLLYLVMELIEGVGLDEMAAEEGRATSNFVLEVAKQCCAGLAQIHAGGMVHRDVKPENLLLVPLADGRVQLKVVDFGIALAERDQAGSLTKTGQPVGTAHYMAPEQAGQGEEVGGAADVYALGVVMYELLAGRAPFAGTTSMMLVRKHLGQQPKSLGTVLPEGAVPPALVETVDQMLEKDPGGRPGNAAQLRSRFAEIQSGLGEDPISVAPEAWPEALYASYVTESPIAGEASEGASEAGSASSMGGSAGREEGTSGAGDRDEGTPTAVRRGEVTPPGDSREEKAPVAAPSSSTASIKSSGDNAFWMVIGAGVLFVLLGSALVYRIAGPEILGVFGVEVAAERASGEKQVTLEAGSGTLVVYREDGERVGETPVTVTVGEATTFRVERGEVSGTVMVSPSSPDVLQVQLKSSGGVTSEADE